MGLDEIQGFSGINDQKGSSLSWKAWIYALIPVGLLSLPGELGSPLNLAK